MPPPRLKAQPITEGFMQTSAGLKLVWREFRWNTGRTDRMWFVDPDVVNEDQIEIRELGSAKDSAGET
ncbi:hypothetical protein TRP8649_04514 [Pelagimonas phthalicica]|jgi:hypothetical protein|uniref:Uncharacterized protein n=1 Tax=Pelagimonas phthalicica TaxID=1037362 RepID=A0A238JI64_9RHOB|nr:hypothetical protein TRP8649_04514 [Pelagimonas phthalicica]